MSSVFVDEQLIELLNDIQTDWREEFLSIEEAAYHHGLTVDQGFSDFLQDLDFDS